MLSQIRKASEKTLDSVLQTSPIPNNSENCFGQDPFRTASNFDPHLEKYKPDHKRSANFETFIKIWWNRNKYSEQRNRRKFLQNLPQDAKFRKFRQDVRKRESLKQKNQQTGIPTGNRETQETGHEASREQKWLEIRLQNSGSGLSGRKIRRGFRLNVWFELRGLWPGKLWFGGAGPGFEDS